MSGIFATAGATIDIGQPLAAKSAAFIAADFAAQSWVNISWAENIGAFGDESSEVTFDDLADGLDRGVQEMPEES